MKSVSRILIAGLLALGLAACATQAQPVQELPSPGARPCDAKTQLESGRRNC